MRIIRIQNSLMLLASLVLCSEAGAMADSNPYQAIVNRNVFGLKDPAPPPIVEPVKPAPKLTLTGITTLGKTRALMTAPPAQPRPGEQPKGPQSFILAQGERDGEVEVVSIDPALGKVTLKIGGEFMTIGFEDTSRSKGGSGGTPLASTYGFSSALPIQRPLMPAFPQSQPAEFAQVTQPAQDVVTASSAAAQPQLQTGQGITEAVPQGSRAAAAENPYASKAIQHPALDPTPGAVQIRTPFPTRSTRGRRPAAYTTLPAPEASGDAPAQPLAQ